MSNTDNLDNAALVELTDDRYPLPNAKLAPFKAGVNVVLVGCGSFNPPTIMHARMFEVATQELSKRGLHVLGGYLSPASDAYAKPGLASASHRLVMCSMLAASHGRLMVDAWEAWQDEYVRTLRVLHRIQLLVGRHRDTEMGEGATDQFQVRAMLVCGADLLESMLAPGLWEAPDVLLRDFGVVCLRRGEAGAKVVAAMDTPGTLLHEFKDRIVLVQDAVACDLSSSMVRAELVSGHSVKYWVLNPVLAYIEEHRLYAGPR